MSGPQDPLFTGRGTNKQPPVTTRTVSSSKSRIPKKRWWRSQKVEEKPDAEFRLEADINKISWLVAARELVPVALIILYVLRRLHVDK